MGGDVVLGAAGVLDSLRPHGCIVCGEKLGMTRRDGPDSCESGYEDNGECNLHFVAQMAGFQFNKAWQFAKLTYERWSRDNVPQLGASLAFYTALSIAPLLVISLAVGAFVFGDDAARGE